MEGSSLGLEDLGGITDVFVFAIGMAVVATILWLAYITMERPRLPVVRSEEEPPRITAAGVVRYVATIPFYVLFWQLSLLGLVAIVSRERTPVEMVVAASAVVGGARLLAHIKPAIAHELAKSVPIAILGFVIIGTGFVGFEGAAQTAERIPFELVDTYWTGLVVWDLLVTSIWFLAIRGNWHLRRRRADAGRPADGLFRRAGKRIGEIGYH